MATKKTTKKIVKKTSKTTKSSIASKPAAAKSAFKAAVTAKVATPTSTVKRTAAQAAIKLNIVSDEAKRLVAKIKALDTKTSLIIGAIVLVVGLGVIALVKNPSGQNSSTARMNSRAMQSAQQQPMMQQQFAQQQPIMQQQFVPQQPMWNQPGGGQWNANMNQNPMFMNTVALAKKTPGKNIAPIQDPITPPAGQIMVREREVRDLQDQIMRMQNDVNQLEQGIIQTAAVMEASANQIDAGRRRAEIALDNARQTNNQVMEQAKQRNRNAAGKLKDLRQRAEDVRDNLNGAMAKAAKINANKPIDNIKPVMFMQPINADRRNMMMGQRGMNNQMMQQQNWNQQQNFQTQPQMNQSWNNNQGMGQFNNQMQQQQNFQQPSMQTINADRRNMMMGRGMNNQMMMPQQQWNQNLQMQQQPQMNQNWNDPRNQIIW
ncbi:MAG: hypothetical protein ACI9CF_000951 [Candidatus Omnitrophota bacterium]|jgi:hypothetical protein